MDTISIKYNISRIAAAALQRLDDPCRLSLYIELLHDAIRHSDYQLPVGEVRPEQQKLVTGTIPLSKGTLQVIQRLQKAGLSVSEIIEEALCYAFRKRLLY